MTPTRTRPVRRRSILVAAVLCVAVAACGSDQDASAPTSAAASAAAVTEPAVTEPAVTEPAATEPAATEPAATEPAATEPAVTEPAATEPAATEPVPDLPQPFEVDVTLDEYEIQIPAEIPSGFVRVVATNAGASEHHVILARIHDGMAYAEWLQAFEANEFAAEGMIDFLGGPNGVQPGATAAAQMDLAPGSYVALSLMPNADGVSEASLGMLAPVTVTDSGETADLTALDIEATVSVTEHEFTVSPGFDGHGLVLVTNTGTQVHEVVVTRIGAGGTFEEYRSALAAGAAPNAPELLADYLTAQGVTAISPGVSIVAELDLDEGDYVFSCLAPDLGDLLPHTMHGEVALVHVPT